MLASSDCNPIRCINDWFSIFGFRLANHIVSIPHALENSDWLHLDTCLCRCVAPANRPWSPISRWIYRCHCTASSECSTQMSDHSSLSMRKRFLFAVPRLWWARRIAICWLVCGMNTRQGCTDDRRPVVNRPSTGFAREHAHYGFEMMDVSV